MLLLIALIALAPATAVAQSAGLGYFYFWGSCANSTNRIVFAGEDFGRHPEVVGFDIYRTLLGSCAPAIRITDAPIPRLLNQEFSHEIFDPAINDNAKYSYQILGVDAARTTLTSLYFVYPEPGSSDRAYVGCGGIAGHGTVVDWGWTVAIESCPGSCLPSFYIETGAEQLQALIGTDVMVYGSFGWSVEGFGLDLESFESVPCEVAVEESTWSHVKTLFQ